MENVLNILDKLKYPLDKKNIKIEVIKREEDGSNYNVYKIITKNDTFILKQCSKQEIKNYEVLNKYNINIPKIYEVCFIDDKSYMLQEFMEGENLCNGTKDKLKKTLDELIREQDLFWDKKDIVFGVMIEDFNKKVVDRANYLKDEVLEEAYSIFLDIYYGLPKTITYCDLLPFNVIVSKDKSFMIDLEECGILPFPLSLVRLLAYGKEDKNFLFYMKEEDKKFASDYYYEKLLKDKGISYEKWNYIFDCFLLYEYCEWVMLKNKSEDNNLEYYNEYFHAAKKYAEKIIKQKNKYMDK